MKDMRNKEIEELKKKLDRDEKQRQSQVPLRSRVDEMEGQKSAKRISKIEHMKSSDDFSPNKNMKTSGIEGNAHSPKKSKIAEK